MNERASVEVSCQRTIKFIECGRDIFSCNGVGENRTPRSFFSAGGVGNLFVVSWPFFLVIGKKKWPGDNIIT